ncbi:MAG: ABC transporter substrate-binding protein [Gammaproteobacteria bacterium]|nr:ABC transporter substrate-binding protein [Gammaproteobacteria bacterium]
MRSFFGVNFWELCFRGVASGCATAKRFYFFSLSLSFVFWCSIVFSNEHNFVAQELAEPNSTSSETKVKAQNNNSKNNDSKNDESKGNDSKEVLLKDFDVHDLEALSLKELINIPLNSDYSHHTIHQPSDNKISDSSFNFGILAPISEFPGYAAEIIAAADSAAAYINQNGGVNGRRLVILRADDKENTQVSAKLAHQLITDYKVKAIIGPATSSSVASVLEQVTIPRKVPLISQAASSVALSKFSGGQWFWRMVANNNQQIDLITNFLHKRKGHSKIFLFTGRDLYGQEIAEGLADYFRILENGFIDQVNLSNLVQLADMTLKDEIESIQSEGVSAIVVTLVNSQVRHLLKKISQHWEGKFPTILVGDTVTPNYLEEADVGTIRSCVFSYVGTANDFSHSLRADITQAIQTFPTGFDGAYVYDATIILAMGFKLSNKFNIPVGEAISAIASDGFMIQTSDYANISDIFEKHKTLQFTGVSGRVWFDAKGDNLTAFSRIYAVGKNSEDTQNNCMSGSVNSVKK